MPICASAQHVSKFDAMSSDVSCLHPKVRLRQNPLTAKGHLYCTTHANAWEYGLLFLAIDSNFENRFILLPLCSGSGLHCSMCNVGLPINQDLLTQRLAMNAGTAGLPTAYPFFRVHVSGQVS